MEVDLVLRAVQWSVRARMMALACPILRLFHISVLGTFMGRGRDVTFSAVRSGAAVAFISVLSILARSNVSVRHSLRSAAKHGSVMSRVASSRDWYQVGTSTTNYQGTEPSLSARARACLHFGNPFSKY